MNLMFRAVKFERLPNALKIVFIILDSRHTLFATKELQIRKIETSKSKIDIKLKTDIIAATHCKDKDSIVVRNPISVTIFLITETFGLTPLRHKT